MPEYRIVNRELHVDLDGHVDADSLTRLFDVIQRDPEFDCNLPQLWHVTPESIDLNASELFRMTRHPTRAIKPRVALIAADNAAYGMCRAYGLWCHDERVDLHAFRSEEDARSWIRATAT